MSKIIIPLTVLFSLLTFSCSSSVDEPLSVNTEEDNATLVELSFDLSSIQNELAELDSLESVEIPIRSTIIGNKRRLSRSSVITPVQGTVKNLGNQKTLWKYGVGENLVPRYLCGATFNEMTVSTLYRISVRYDLTDDFMVKGFTGDYSGWNGTYIYNPQTKYQGTYGDNTYIEFYTFVYDIISTVQGYTPPGGHLWVPFKESEAKIYVKIFE